MADTKASAFTVTASASGADLFPLIQTAANKVISFTNLRASVLGGFTAGAIAFANSSGVLAQDATNLFWDDTNNYLGIQTAAPVVPCQVGNGTIATPDAVFAAAMNFTGIGNAHCFNDSNVFNRSGSTSSYNSYDARPAITTIGTTGGAHYAGYQFRPSLDFTTTLPEMRGYHFSGATELTAGGTVTDMYAFMASSPTVTSGAVTSFYGYYLAASTGGITNYYGLYFAGTPTNLMGSGFTGFGTTAPAAVIHMGGNRSAAAWTTSGIALRQAAATYTDTSSSGTVAACYVNAFATPTLAASSATTYTTAANMLIGAAPSAGSNVTITNPYSLIVSGFTRFNSYVAIGSSTNPTSCLHIGTNQTAASWGTQGLLFHIGNQTLTDSTGSGTIASRSGSSIYAPTFAASSAVTVTNGATFYIAGAPANGTNMTVTNPWAIWVDAGDVRFDGDVAIGLTTVPTKARLEIAGGTTTQAPINIASGTNKTTAAAGDLEYNGTNLFFTRSGTTRENVICASAVTTEVIVSDTSLTINYNGTTYKLLARA